MATLSEVLKQFNSLKLDKFRPTTSNTLERAREVKKYFRQLDSIFTTLAISDANQIKIIKIHEYDLVRRAEAAIEDAQVDGEKQTTSRN